MIVGATDTNTAVPPEFVTFQVNHINQEVDATELDTLLTIYGAVFVRDRVTADCPDILSVLIDHVPALFIPIIAVLLLRLKDKLS